MDLACGCWADCNKARIFGGNPARAGLFSGGATAEGGTAPYRFDGSVGYDPTEGGGG